MKKEEKIKCLFKNNSDGNYILINDQNDSEADIIICITKISILDPTDKTWSSTFYFDIEKNKTKIKLDKISPVTPFTNSRYDVLRAQYIQNINSKVTYKQYITSDRISSELVINDKSEQINPNFGDFDTDDIINTLLKLLSRLLTE